MSAEGAETNPSHDELSASQIQNPKSLIGLCILCWPLLRRLGAQAVQTEISDFGFEMQDSSNFKISGGGSARKLSSMLKFS